MWLWCSPSVWPPAPAPWCPHLALEIFSFSLMLKSMRDWRCCQESLQLAQIQLSKNPAFLQHHSHQPVVAVVVEVACFMWPWHYVWRGRVSLAGAGWVSDGEVTEAALADMLRVTRGPGDPGTQGRDWLLLRRSRRECDPALLCLLLWEFDVIFFEDEIIVNGEWILCEGMRKYYLITKVFVDCMYDDNMLK